MTRRTFLTATEAAAALGVRLPTLYPYVSRGLLRSEPGAGGRARGYPAADVEALRQRSAIRRDPPRAVRQALDWGAPVLDSALTLIAGGRLFYRGEDAVELARRGESLERVAALLWLGRLDAPLPAPAPWRLAVLPRLEPELAASRAWRPFQRMQVWLPLATAEDPGAYDLRPAAVMAAGAWLLPLLAMLAAGTTRGLRDARAAPERMRAAAVLAHAWAPAEGAATDADTAAELARLLDLALVLSADHELNVSAFTARCVASAGAPPQAAVAAGLQALGGVRHGGQAERVEALLAELAAGGSIRDRLAARLRRGEEIPGFGHRLYLEGDPRARLLLDVAAARRPVPPVAELAAEVAAAAFDLLHERPNLDFGLVTLAQALGLPAGAPTALFAVGRSAGWIAHVLEQIADGRLIRPRARYIGPQP
ncbi:MAG TPA: citrate synthase [Thermoanaerobaculia bacterium]|nr:citrate synthase [Thermoanaerobaculia bacterium]